MLVKFKLEHPDAKLPTQSEGDVGFDLYSCEEIWIPSGRVAKIKTGLHIADYEPGLSVKRRTKSAEGFAWTEQEGFKLTVYPKIEGRSSLGSRGIFTVAGIIDPIYRGELAVALANMTGDDYKIEKGDKIAQFVFYTCLTAPELEFEVTDTIVPTRRGDKGFGSTGR